MNNLAIRVRGSRQAQTLRFEFAAALGISPDECDRIALSLGLAGVRASKAGDQHPLRRLAARWRLQLRFEERDNEELGDEHDLARIDGLDAGRNFWTILTAYGGLECDISHEIRRSLNAGYRHLGQIYTGLERDAFRTVNTLAECLASAVPNQESLQSNLPSFGPIRIELGRDPSNGQRIEWVVNREDGEDTSASLRIAGAQGKGKSQALLGLLLAIVEAAPSTGFILLDYKGDLSEGQTGEPFIKSTARPQLIRPPDVRLPINPFDLPRGANPQLAAEIFSSTLATFIPQMGGYQQGIVDKALTQAYAAARQANRDGPSLTQARDAVRNQYRREGRQDDTVTLALDRLATKPIFSQTSEIDVTQVFQQRWLIDLSKLGELRTYVAFILLHFLRQVAQTLPDAPFDPRERTRTLRGVVAVDEAHNYLTKGKKSQPLAELVRIGRSKGVPVFLSSQSLDDFKGDTAWRELVPSSLLFGHGVPPDAESVRGALRVDPRIAKKAAGDCLSLEQFMALTHRHRDEDGVPKKVRVTPLYERVASRMR